MGTKGQDYIYQQRVQHFFEINKLNPFISIKCPACQYSSYNSISCWICKGPLLLDDLKLMFVLRAENGDLIITNQRPKPPKSVNFVQYDRSMFPGLSKDIEDLQKRIMIRMITEFYPDATQNIKLPGHYRGYDINMQSIELLLPGKWLNDKIMDFYCEYLAHEVYPNKDKSYLVYSVYFWKSLVWAVENSNFSRMQRPRKEIIFDKDFVVFGLNVWNSHWIVAAIINPNQLNPHVYSRRELHRPLVIVSGLNNENLRKDQYIAVLKRDIENQLQFLINRDYFYEPYICIFDSLGYQHPKVEKYLKIFVAAEFERVFKSPVSCDKMIVLYARVPKQPNDSDCGIFSLHNIEMCLKYRCRFSSLPPNMDPFFSSLVNDKRIEILSILQDLHCEATAMEI